MKKFVLILAAVLGLFGVWNLAKSRNMVNNSQNNLQVATSFYPLYFFATEVGGEKVKVVNLTPPGAEPHDYELTPQDINAIEQSKVLLISGKIEPWADRIEETLESKTVKVYKISDGLLDLESEDEDGEVMADPHIWLDPVLALQEVTRIQVALATADPVNATYYKDRAEVLKTKLIQLDQDFQQGLKSCRQHTIVTSHAAFGYLARRYGLKQVAVSGLSPEEEPSPSQLAQIATFAKNEGVKYIFFETLVSPRLSETLASEIGAKTIVFNPLEGLTEEEQAAGQNYLTVQRQNLDNLRMALECE